jgi:hypothetical protein
MARTTRRELRELRLQRQGRARARRRLVASLTVTALLVTLAGVAVADTLNNTVTSGGAAARTTNPGVDLSATYSIAAAGTCEVATTPRTVQIVTPAAVTSDKTQLTFTACGVAGQQTVKFTSNVLGEYAITHTADGDGFSSGATELSNSADFVLIVADTLAPTDASVVINDGDDWTNDRSVLLTLAAKDFTGVVRYRLATTENGLNPADDVAVNPSQTDLLLEDVPFQLAAGDGEDKRVWARFCDGPHPQGNCVEVSGTIGLDTADPLVAITSPTDGTTVGTSPISVSGTASDALSGLAGNKVVLDVDGGTGVDSNVASGVWGPTDVTLDCGLNTITATATDNAGNEATDSIEVTLNCTQSGRAAPAVVNQWINHTANPTQIGVCITTWGEGGKHAKTANWRGKLISAVAHWAATQNSFTEADIASEFGCLGPLDD